MDAKVVRLRGKSHDQATQQGRELLAAPIFGALCRLAPDNVDWRCVHMSKMRFITQRR
jgi:hypothetical protein